MRNRKYLLVVLLVALCMGLTQFASASQDEDYTLATVPALRHVGESGNIHIIQIDTDNPQYTSVYIEISDSRKDFSEYTSWRPLSSFDNDRFTLTLEDGQSVYLRIKARNENGFETTFSEILRVDNKPTKPVPVRQEQAADNIIIYLPPLEDGINYWVMREDVGIPQKVIRTPYVDNTVRPAREYTYIFWSDNNGVESDKNTITLWTKPELPGIKKTEVFYNEIILDIDLKDNPKDIEILVDAGDEDFDLNGNQIRLTGLKQTTEYVVKARLKSKNNEFTEWVIINAITGKRPRLDRTQVLGYDAFLKEAKESIERVQYKVDGKSNSGTAWLEIRAIEAKFNVKAKVADQTKTLTGNYTKFEGLEDNKTYAVEITVSNEDFTYSETIKVTTPNRTAPRITGGYYDEEIGELILEVESVKGVRE